jgi:23S rRNA (adenine2503-C2)-methyltransferase
LAQSAVLDGEAGYRARQITDWVYRRSAHDFAAMTNLSRTLRERLDAGMTLYASSVAGETRASDGTRKLLLRWGDGATTECVLIPDADRHTACISTQVGCPVGCAFCASGLDGLQRNLTAGQIVEQAMRARGLIGDDGDLTNVVFMGLGEPLANYHAVVRAVRTLNADWGMNIGARRITISTVGLPTPMRKLADEGLQITLALSLHAPTDTLRRKLIPWAERVSIQDLVEAARYYFNRTGREVTLEYVLLAAVNDATHHARTLADVARQIRCNVNLIRYNPVPDLPFRRPSAEAAQRFLSTLRERGINAHLRRSRGRDVAAACGQLRRRILDGHTAHAE